MLILLGTEGCHLCELAQGMLAQALSASPEHHQVQLIDIAEQGQWSERYEERIPVLIDQHSGQALCWPFELAEVQDFIKATNGLAAE